MTNQPKPLSWRMKQLVRLLVSGDATIESNLQTLEQWADVDAVLLERQLAEAQAKLASAELLRAELCKRTGEETVPNALVKVTAMREAGESLDALVPNGLFTKEQKAAWRKAAE